VARQQIEELRVFEGDPREQDPEDIEPMRAYKLMPRWGQVVAWIAWELPWQLYTVVTGGLLWAYCDWSTTWKIAVVVCLALGYGASRFRKVAPNPFRKVVIVTRKLMPRELIDAAERGQAPGV